jgi:hypothetical protein
MLHQRRARRRSPIHVAAHPHEGRIRLDNERSERTTGQAAGLHVPDTIRASLGGTADPTSSSGAE